MDNPAVLIVDDSETTGNIVAALVKLCGYPQVDQARCGAEALKFMKWNQYAFVLCDMFMPSIDGLQLLSIVRSDAALRDTCFY